MSAGLACRKGRPRGTSPREGQWQTTRGLQGRCSLLCWAMRSRGAWKRWGPRPLQPGSDPPCRYPSCTLSRQAPSRRVPLRRTALRQILLTRPRRRGHGCSTRRPPRRLLRSPPSVRRRMAKLLRRILPPRGCGRSRHPFLPMRWRPRVMRRLPPRATLPPLPLPPLPPSHELRVRLLLLPPLLLLPSLPRLLPLLNQLLLYRLLHLPRHRMLRLPHLRPRL